MEFKCDTESRNEYQIKRHAIILAAGKGSRMGADVPKQYIEVMGKPMLYYTLRAFDESIVDEIILVVSSEDRNYVRDLVHTYDIKKVCAIVSGGSERYDSVYKGLEAIHGADTDIVLIHDGARACVSKNLIEKMCEEAILYTASIPVIKLKDTIRMMDADGYGADIVDRNMLYAVQTPQVFTLDVIRKAFRKLFTSSLDKNMITDDAMVVEAMLGIRVHLAEGEERNIKVTTPSDLDVVASLLFSHTDK